MTKEEAKKLKEFCKIIGVRIKDLELLKTALTHRSYLNENPNEVKEHNERLEFLGDAVLEILVSKHLFDNYPEKTEGDLTSFRAAAVRTESLSEEATKNRMGEFIFMSKGEEKTGGREREYILANTFEAVIGAIYIDRGLQVVDKLLRKKLYYKIPKIIKERLDIDSKSKLQEVAQEIVKETPTYEVVSTNGPDHRKLFTMKVVIGDKRFGRGQGLSKQEAEQNAAADALENWKELISKHFGID